MRRIKEVVRLRFEAGFGHRQIVRSCCSRPGRVRGTQSRSVAASDASVVATARECFEIRQLPPGVPIRPVGDEQRGLDPLIVPAFGKRPGSS